MDPWDIEPEKKSIIVNKHDEPIINKGDSTERFIIDEECSPITDDDIIASNESNIEDDTFIDLPPEPPPDLFIPSEEGKIKPAIVANKIVKPKLDLILDTKEDIDINTYTPFAKDDIVLSFSLIDRMFFKGDEIDHCPQQIWGIINGIRMPGTESMEAGNLFESLLIGENRNGSKTTQIRRKVVSQKAINDAIKAGKPIPEPEMRIDEIRIREQVERSKILFYNHKINIFPGVNTQVPIYRILNGIKLQGHLDLFPTDIIWNGEEYQAILDIKLTAARASAAVTKYCWAQPTEIDFTQAIIYRILLESIDYSINPYLKNLFQGKELQFTDALKFFYYVADYRPKKGEQLWSDFFEVQLTPDRIRDAKELIRKTHILIEQYKEHGWSVNPTYDRCKNCTMNYKIGGSCKNAINNLTI